MRNDHANVQFRINGVMLPDGVTGFGSVLDPSLIGSISLITGALPAEFGMRTVGLIDITTRNDIFNNSGSISYYGGSRGTIQPSFEYGGTFGSTCPSGAPAAANSSTSPIKTRATQSSFIDCFPGVQYLFTGRYLQTTEGIENPLSSLNAIHDLSNQYKGFAYMSAFVDPATRVSLIAGTATNWFQIPNVPGQPVGLNGNPPVTSAFGITNFNSAALNENQYEDTQFGVLALQRSINGFDGQVSYFTRYNFLHFMPDPVGDLLINGIASDITRESYSNGIQGDASYIINSAHTLRTGFTVSGEQTAVGNQSLVEPDGRDGTDRRALDDHRRRLENRLARRHLCAGRVEAHQQPHGQLRRALRPDVAIRRCQSAQPAHQLHLQAVRIHHVPCRLCALLHPARYGRGGASQHRIVHRHDRGTGERRHRSGAAGAVQLFRCRC